MPFEVVKRGREFVVVTQGTGKVHGRFSSRVKAYEQLRALYANVREARRK